MSEATIDSATGWWRTSIIDIHPGSIRVRGYAIEELIGTIGFPDMVWLMLRGELPTPAQGRLLGAALVAAVDHGPQAPSIATARMAATCGVGLNNAIASGINALGDVHGGAGQQCMELYAAVAARLADHVADGMSVAGAAESEIAARLERREHIPGFGHRFHPVDPRAGRLLALVDAARGEGAVTGEAAVIGRAVEDALAARKGRRLPMNIDGATAVVFAELGFPSGLGRGLFVLSRSVGIMAHAWEQSQQGGRIKGPMPPSIPYRYDGAPPRPVSGDGA
ncbi:citryl-CoA lyase (plasmid) [Azospirillum oryzae]|uniref:citrate synthase (unknown stereospecificity) n=1 Tax=Azospirillum oryzae TaxID=286727 RepID=A0A6N1AJ83_9PROT|nr:citryl-CoA lyase [Azospirillum oryzae]KAA0584419.1 citryl-CoA lyase [Azospirillum oryzae]QKS50427.1 citryl-CoA lyase [Azospirillum oryzae]GLR81841.1 citryl-CoA lyase [Azospirillum oryzae]